MRIFKTKAFDCWAIKTGLNNEVFQESVAEIQLGQYEASLGGYLYKKRIALGNKGKNGGVRTVIAFKNTDKAIFVYGFAKNKKANIAPTELAALKKLVKLYFSYTDEQIIKILKIKEFIEVE